MSRLSPEERRARMEATLSELTKAVQSVTSSADWQAVLDTWSRLRSSQHPYSVRNSLWLWAQGAQRGINVDLVGGYRFWQAAGRQVRRGEEGLHVLAPVTRRAEEAEPGPPGVEAPDSTGPAGPTGSPRVLVGFRVQSVFDVSQTDGPPLSLPSVVERLPEGQAPPRALDDLELLIRSGGWTVVRERIDLAPVPLAERAIGLTDFTDRVVKVDEELAGAAAYRTLAHEAAHVHLHQGSTSARAVVEVEAESVSYLLCAAVGIDSSCRSVGYVANWSAGRPEIVLGTAERSVGAATVILDALVAIAASHPAEALARPVTLAAVALAAVELAAPAPAHQVELDPAPALGPGPPSVLVPTLF